MTDAERVLWSYLKSRQIDGFHFRKQVPIGPYIADFVCVKAKLVIEVDGHTHTSDAEIAHDQRRTNYMIHSGWKILRFWNDHIFKDINSALSEISHTLSSTTCGGGGWSEAEVGGGADGVTST